MEILRPVAVGRQGPAEQINCFHRVMREAHFLALLIDADQVTAPACEARDALHKAFKLEAFLTWLDGKRFAEFGQRQRPLSRR